jgi:2-polyprenyl-6-hydroxyphenyl methylase/3-demethylubiquinone-9 3-methyltransferase
MSQTTLESVQEYFDDQSRVGRRLLPDPETLDGMGRHQKYEMTVEAMAAPGVEDILDVGCNRGSIEYLFCKTHPQRIDDVHIEGIDISESAIQQARQLELPNCTFRSFDGGSLPYDSEQFDLVLLIEVLEHVIDKPRLLSEIRRVLRPSGRLLFTTPNPECWPLRAESRLLRTLRQILRKRIPAKDDYIKHDELVALLQGVGFEQIDPGPMFAVPRLFMMASGTGWGLIPPLPKKMIFHYQKMCLKCLGDRRFPAFFERRLKWSLVGVLRKCTPLAAID